MTTTDQRPETGDRRPKPRYPHARANEVACLLAARLAPVCERLAIAGSLRRRKETVGDIELVFVPKYGPRAAGGELLPTFGALTDPVLERLEAEGTLARRQNKNGGTAWGGKNKLAVHVPTGIPVDLFTASAENWWNYLVCRTGPAESNLALCAAAHAKGWKWEPYSSGFVKQGGFERHVVTSERDVFEFVGLPYRPPEERR